MTKKTHLLVLGAALFLGAAFIGASAFTTATLSREANIDVVADPSGIIGLQDGNSGGLVFLGSDGELKIDFDRNNNGLGVNTNSTYELGDPNNGATEFAFNITNQDTIQHNINLTYSPNDATVVDGFNNTEFQVFDTTGTRIATVSEEGSGADFTAAAGSTHHVVLVVDTLNANVDNSTTLSGTLNVTAT